MKLWAAAAALALSVAASAQSGIPTEVILDFNLDAGVEITDAVVAELDSDGSAYTLISSFLFSGSGSTVVDSDANPIPAFLGAVGRYTYAENTVLTEDGVAVFMSNGIAPEVIGSGWDDVFPGYSEELIAQSLLDIQNDGDPAAQQSAVNNLFNFFSAFPTYFPASTPNDGSWVGFSSAAIYGTGSWTTNAVPEPGIMAAAVLGGVALLRRRRN